MENQNDIENNVKKINETSKMFDNKIENIDQQQNQVKEIIKPQNEKEKEKEKETEEKFTILSLQNLINLNRKIRQHKRITIDLTKCQYEVVRNVASEQFTWNIIVENEGNNKDFNLQWCDTYIDEQDLRQMLPYQKINRFPGSYNLGRKNFLARNLTKMKKNFQDDYNFYPKTFLLPYQQEELRQFIIKNNYQKVLIVKPENQSQGKGIYLTRKLENIEFGEHVVVQEYLNNPFLLEGLKFDLRIYVLLKSVYPLKIFIYKEGLGRFSTVKYEKVNNKNMNEKCMHLTNYAINKLNPNFIFNQQESKDNIGHKRSLSSVLKMLQDKKKDVKKLWKEIQQIVVSSLISCNPYLSHTYKSCQPKEENSEMAFELFGYDIILDEDFKPWLLEVNHTPSFSIDTPLDTHIKSCLILDTLILENLTWKSRKQYYESRSLNNQSIKGIVSNKLTKEEIQEKKAKIIKWEQNNLGGYEKIFPDDDQTQQEKYNQFLLFAQDQYDEWSGAKICRGVKKDVKNEKIISTTQQNQQKSKQPQKQLQLQSTEPQSPTNKRQKQSKQLNASKDKQKENNSNQEVNQSINANKDDEILIEGTEQQKNIQIDNNDLIINRQTDRPRSQQKIRNVNKNQTTGTQGKLYQNNCNNNNNSKKQNFNWIQNTQINIYNINTQLENQFQQDMAAIDGSNQMQNTVQHNNSTIQNYYNFVRNNQLQEKKQKINNSQPCRPNLQETNNNITLPLVKQSNAQSSVAIIGTLTQDKYLQQQQFLKCLKNTNKIDQIIQKSIQQINFDKENENNLKQNISQINQNNNLQDLNNQSLSQQISCPQLIQQKKRNQDYLNLKIPQQKIIYLSDLNKNEIIYPTSKIFSKLVYSNNNAYQQQTPSRVSVPIRSYNFQKNLQFQISRNE